MHGIPNEFRIEIWCRTSTLRGRDPIHLDHDGHSAVLCDHNPSYRNEHFNAIFQEKYRESGKNYFWHVFQGNYYCFAIGLVYWKLRKLIT